MIGSLKSYPEMRPTGVECLGDIPKHWEIRRFKHLLLERDTRSRDGREQLLRVSQYTGVTQRSPAGEESAADTRAKSLVGYKCVEPNDLVVNIMLAWNGSMGVSRFTGIASPAYCVYRFRANATPWYFHYVLRSVPFKSRIKAVSTGVVESRLRLYTDDLFRLESPLPSSSEQTAIARFLDHVDRRIQRYIRAKKQLIELLEEQKQAIIHQAVTGQIDVHTGQPYPAYRHSGAEWLGDIPTHWDVRKLKYLTPGITVGIVVTPSKYYVDEGIPCLRSLNVSRGVIDMENFVFISEDANKLHRKSRIFAGDIVVVRTGQAGTAAIVPEELDGANCIDLLIVRRSKDILSQFMYYYLNSRTAISQATELSVGAIQAHYNTSTLSQLVVPKIPTVEQSRIVTHIDKAKGKIDLLIAKVGQVIDYLNSYRTRLIADVVTGKLDVREAAAALPKVDPFADDDEVDDSPDTGNIPAVDQDKQPARITG